MKNPLRQEEWSPYVAGAGLGLVAVFSLLLAGIVVLLTVQIAVSPSSTAVGPLIASTSVTSATISALF